MTMWPATLVKKCVSSVKHLSEIFHKATMPNRTPTVTGFKTDTLAKTFGLQNRTLVFDKIPILSKVHCHQKSILNQKTTQFKVSHDHVLQT